ncbi:MAG: hypothetical protein LBT98_00570 [Puniceicoccales bacterium]|nr:hypothetical protein [Puniceicoccales bacterium]
MSLPYSLVGKLIQLSPPSHPSFMPTLTYSNSFNLSNLDFSNLLFGQSTEPNFSPCTTQANANAVVPLRYENKNMKLVNYSILKQLTTLPNTACNPIPSFNSAQIQNAYLMTLVCILNRDRPLILKKSPRHRDQSTTITSAESGSNSAIPIENAQKLDNQEPALETKAKKKKRKNRKNNKPVAGPQPHQLSQTPQISHARVCNIGELVNNDLHFPALESLNVSEKPSKKKMS